MTIALLIFVGTVCYVLGQEHADARRAREARGEFARPETFEPWS